MSKINDKKRREEVKKTVSEIVSTREQVQPSEAEIFEDKIKEETKGEDITVENFNLARFDLS